MDDSTIKALNLLSTLKSAVDVNNVKKWKAKGSSQRYKEEIEKLNAQIDMIINVDNKRIDNEIKELTLQNEILANVSRTLKQGLRVNTETLLHLKAHQECVKDKLKMRKEQGRAILDNYMQQYKKCEEKLAKTNPTYKILEEKRAHLKRIQFHIKKIENELKEMEWKKNYIFNIRQKLFYEDFVSLAKAWIANRDYHEAVKKIEEHGNTAKQLLQEHKDLTVKIKEKKRITMSKKSVQNKQPTYNALQKLKSPSSPHLSKTVLNQIKFGKPVHFLNHGLVQQNNSYVPPKPLINASIVGNEQCTFKQSDKIKILEDKQISVPKKDSIVTNVDAMTQEEKSRAVHDKLKNYVENFKTRRISHRRTTQSFHEHVTEEQIKMVPSEPLNESNQNHQPEARSSQQLDNCDNFSQETDVVNLFSQDPNKSFEINISKFKYDEEQKVMVEEKKNFDKESETFVNSSQGKVNASVNNYKSNVEGPFERKMNVPGTPGPINFPEKLAGARTEVNLKNQQFNNVNKKTTQEKTILDKTTAHKYFKAPNDVKFGRNAPISMATGPQTASQENKFNVQNEKNCPPNNFNENPPFGNNVQKTTENQNNIQINTPFSIGVGPKTGSQENKLNVQNEKNCPPKNFYENPPFGNNVQKTTENQNNFQMNAPFFMGVGPKTSSPETMFNVQNEKNSQANNVQESIDNPNFQKNNPFTMLAGGASGSKTHPDPFDQNLKFKRPKLDLRQEPNKPSLNKQGASMNEQNVESQNTDNMSSLNDIQYNFGNITSQFMDNSPMEVGDLNVSYYDGRMSPDLNSSLMKSPDDSQNPGIGISFSGTDFNFGQPTEDYVFNFK